MITIFKDIDIASRDLIKKYLSKVSYEACEYNFTTLFMWQHYYNTRYVHKDDFVVIIGGEPGDEFSIMPLADRDNSLKAIEFISDYFKDNGLKFMLRAATSECVKFLEENYPGRFEFTPLRDSFDYVYDAEMLRTLTCKKCTKKRNHYNYFMRTYGDSYSFRRLGKEDFGKCMEILDSWNKSKLESSSTDEIDSINNENIAIRKLFDNYEKLDIKVFGVFINGSLEAFTIGDYINSDMALIHIEKADPTIRGLYTVINKLFLEQEFPDVSLVNREEDLGIEGLRKAKLSYSPERFVEKFVVTEK